MEKTARIHRNVGKPPDLPKKYDLPIEALEVGDCFDVPLINDSQRTVCYNKAKRLGMKVAIRMFTDEGRKWLRIYRRT